MRRSIDDYPFDEKDMPAGWKADELIPVSWGVAISDDYEDAEPRIVLTVEEIGSPGEGLVADMTPVIARRLRAAIADGLKEIGQDTGK